MGEDFIITSCVLHHDSGLPFNRVDALTAELKADGYEVISGPRTTGDGYYESCIVAVEDNQIEITV